MDISSKSPQELQIELGAAIKATRLGKNITQKEVAKKADIAVRAIVQLEAGRGSTIDTLVRTLKAIGAADMIERLVPRPGVSPIALLKGSEVRKRARHVRISSPDVP